LFLNSTSGTGGTIACDSANNLVVKGGTTEAFRIAATGGIVDFRATMGNGSDDPTTDAPTDWVEVKISGTTYYLPAYT